MTATGPSMILNVKEAMTGVCFGFMTDKMSNILVNGFYVKTAHCEPALKKETINRIKNRLFSYINPKGIQNVRN
jgi:hypothetical protein